MAQRRRQVTLAVAVVVLQAALLAQNTSLPTTDETELRDQVVTSEDVAILQRADEILSSAAVWNRHDTRICNQDDRTWSLFCALEKASLFVLGEYRHREVALQEVRFAVEEASQGKQFEHRLMDYNNLPTTTFDDIKRVLGVAKERVAARLTDQNAKR